MKQLNIHLRTLFLFMLLSIASTAWAETATVEITGTTSATITGAPTEASVSYSQTFGTKFQSTSGKSATLTIKGMSGYIITSIKLYTHSNNSAGAGSFTVTAGTTELMKISGKYKPNWSTAYTSNYEWITPAMTKNDYEIQNEDVVFSLSCTTNSLYWQSVEITYEAASNKPSVYAFSFDREQAEAKVGQTDATLPTLTAKYTADEIIPTDLITYTSGTPSVADFDDNGALVMKSAGTSVITASFAGNETYRSAKATYTLTVSQYTAQQFEWSPSEDMSFFLNEIPDSMPTLIAKDANGNVFSSDKYIIESNNEKVATIGTDNQININEQNYAGTATITARLNDAAYQDTTASFKIVTKRHSCSTFKFKNDSEVVSSISLTVGDAMPTLPTIFNEYGYDCTYSVECKDGFATITDAGVLTLNNGTNKADTVTVKVDGYKLGYDNVSAQYTITINRKETTASYSPTEGVYDLASGEVFAQPNFTYTKGYDGNVTFSSDKEGVATVDAEGVITPKFMGTATITATLPQTDTYAATTATYTLKVKDSNIKYVLVTDAADLKEGDKVIIACNTNNAVAGDLGSNEYMSKLTATFSDDKTECTSCDENVLVLTLGKDGENWTFANLSDALLGAKAVKNLAFGSGTTTWTISITNNNATVKNTNSSNGTMYYNSGSPRFTTYTSSSQTAIQLYKKASGAPVVTTPELSFEKATYEAVMGEEFNAPVLNNPKNVDVTYSSRNEYVATVNETTGAVDVKGVGQTVITASFAGNETLEAASASYTLIVKAAGQSTGTEETVTTNSLGWATFAPSHNIEMTTAEGVEVYYVTAVSDGENATATMADAKGIVTNGYSMAAGTGVLIKAEPNTTVSFMVNADNGVKQLDGNMLVGVTVDTDMSTLENAYIFTKYNGAIGFYECNKGTIKANKCYLQLSSEASGAPAFFTLNLNDVPTDITDVTVQPVGDGKMYNVLGQEVTENYKGLVIKNGRKYINK